MNKQNNIHCFFVSPGLDEEDNVPQWVRDLSPEDIGLSPLPSEFPETKGNGFLSIDKKNLDWTYVPQSQEINDGDIVRVRSDYYKVLGFCPDFYSPNFNAVRFTTDLKKNAKRATYGIIKPPILKGNLVSLPKIALNDHAPVTVVLSNIAKDDFHGTLNVTFKNACFNLLGFMVHDTAI